MALEMIGTHGLVAMGFGDEVWKLVKVAGESKLPYRVECVTAKTVRFRFTKLEEAIVAFKQLVG